MNRRPPPFDFFQGASQRVIRAHLVVAGHPNDEERPRARRDEQRLQQAERGAVGPLQVVQKERQGVLA